jgi:tetratricopeptide (TPR) repeat protein
MVKPYALFTLPCLFFAAAAGFAQNTPTPPESASKPDKASAYYHYSVGHLYAELASAYGNRGDLFNKAIDNLKLAMKADPSASFISEELSDLYIQGGRLREAVTDAEDALKQNPDDLNARRLLARIYTRMIGDSQSNKIDEGMVKKAIEQYSKITEKDPKDADSWLMLGRLQKISQNSVDAEKAYKKALELDPDNEDALTGLAMVYSDLGDNKSATELLRKAAEKDPNPRSLSTLASAYESMKDYGLAAETLRKALDQAPGNAELERALAQDLLLSDRLDEALKIYQQLVSDDPKDSQSYLRLSQIYRQKRDFSRAREAAEKAKELDPTNLEIQYNDVNLLEAEGKNAQAISTLKEILNSTAKKSYSASEKSNRILLLERLGYLYGKNDQLQPAVDAFRQIADLDPDSAPRATAEIIEAYQTAKDYQKAEQEANAAMKKFPNDRTIVRVHASLLADRGKVDQAAAEVTKLLNGKEDRETYIWLAELYEKGKNWTEMGKALDASEKLSTAKDEQETVHFMRGAMYERMKNFDGAEAEFRKVLEINPENAGALNYLGYMLADRNVRLQEAQDLIQKAVDHDPSNGAYLDSLGWVFFRLNKLPDAEKSLMKALESMAKDPTVHDHLGDVYFHEGKIREAIAQWQSSLKEWEASPPSEMDESEVAKVQKKLEGAKVRQARENNGKPQP